MNNKIGKSFVDNNYMTQDFINPRSTFNLKKEFRKNKQAKKSDSNYELGAKKRSKVLYMWQML